MMRVFVTLVLAALLVAGGYFLYTSPRIQELLQPSPEKSEDPLKFLKEEPAGSSPRRERPRRSRQRSSPPSHSEEPPPAPETVSEPAVPNPEVASVLLGILRARGLAQGITLGVSDEVLACPVKSRLWIRSSRSSTFSTKAAVRGGWMLTISRSDRRGRDSSCHSPSDAEEKVTRASSP